VFIFQPFLLSVQIQGVVTFLSHPFDLSFCLISACQFQEEAFLCHFQRLFSIVDLLNLLTQVESPHSLNGSFVPTKQ